MLAWAFSGRSNLLFLLFHQGGKRRVEDLLSSLMLFCGQEEVDYVAADDLLGAEGGGFSLCLGEHVCEVGGGGLVQVDEVRQIVE